MRFSPPASRTNLPGARFATCESGQGRDSRGPHYSTILSSSLRDARRAGLKTTTSSPKAKDKHAQKMAMLRTGVAIRLTRDALKGPLFRQRCAPGTGQIYKFVPLFVTTSNGYVGRNETTVLKRIQGHKTPNSACTGLCNAIQKHGLEQFAVVILEDGIPTSALANAEARLVAEHDTYHNGYNCTPGGEAPPLLVPEIAAKVKATKNTPESKAKTSAASRRHWDDPEKRATHAAALAKSRRDPSVRKKASAASTKRWQEPGYKERLSAVHKVAQNKPERKEQISEQMTALWSDPEYKKSRSQAIKEGRARAKAARGGVVKYVRRT